MCRIIGSGYLLPYLRSGTLVAGFDFRVNDFRNLPKAMSHTLLVLCHRCAARSSYVMRKYARFAVCPDAGLEDKAAHLAAD